jgi:hypothetical protein
VTGGDTGPRHPAEPPTALTAGLVATLPELAAVLRWLRRRQAWTRAAAPLTYRDLAAATGWSYGSFSGYFRGIVLPPSDRFDTLIGLLGATPAERAHLATVRDGVADQRNPDPPDVPIAPSTAELDAQVGVHLLDSAPTGELLARIDREVRAVGAGYTHSGPLACAGRLTETLARLDLLADRRLNTVARRDLDLLAGIVHRLLGHAHYDLGNAATSFRHGRAALWHADRAGHPAMRAHALDLLTGVAYRAGATDAALRYSRQGLWHTRHNQGDVAAALLVGEARACAALGDTRRACRALTEAGRVFDDCEPDEVSRSAYVLRFNRAVHAFQAADLLVDIPGQEAAAERYARRSVDLHDRGRSPGPSSPRYQAVSFLTLAQCLVRAHDLAGAINTVDEMPALRPSDVIETVVLSARRLVVALGDRRRGTAGTALLDRLGERVGPPR